VVDRAKWLILGGSGQLGTAMVESLSNEDVEHVAPGRSELDLLGPDLEQAVHRLRPTTIVNASAYNRVDDAERAEEQEALLALNRELPRRLAQLSRDAGIPFVHVSTDYVFDGNSGRPYTEADSPAPLQRYGQSKYEGELAVAEAYPEAIVVRTSTVFGRSRRGGSNYVAAILAQARAGRPIVVVEPPVASPTWSVDLADAIRRLIQVRAGGLVHVVNAGACSRLELARGTLAAAGLDVHVGVRDPPEGLAPRPDYSALALDRYRELTGAEMPGWEQAVASYVATLG